MRPIVTGALGTVSKGLVKRLEKLEIRGRIETIKTTALLRLARLLKKGRKLETCGLSNSTERPPALVGVKKSPAVILVLSRG